MARIKNQSFDQPYVIGIDPSIAGTAAAVLWRDGTLRVCRFESTPDHRYHRIVRFRNTIRDILGWLTHLAMPAYAKWIEIEGYAFAASFKAHPAGEFGGLLRAAIFDVYQMFPHETAPTSLKLFATGNGRADKDVVVRCVSEEWHHRCGSHDEADAIVAAKIAACRVGFADPIGQHQHEALAVVRKKRKPLSRPSSGKPGRKKKNRDPQETLPFESED